MVNVLSSSPAISSSEYVYEIVTGTSNESRTVVEFTSAVTSNTTRAALVFEVGMLVVAYTVSESRLLI